MSKTSMVMLFLTLAVVSGCDTAYYGAWEKLGVHKRDILRDRVEAAMVSQEDAKEEFRSAFERFESVAGTQSGALKDAYTELQSTYDDAESRADAVHNRIEAVDAVSGDLFAEWEAEIQQISNTRMQSDSRRQLKSSQAAYQGLMVSMRRAEARMQSVLTAFKDQVLYLKHNLNAQAISSLRGELKMIENDVGRLIAEMEESIRKSQMFLKDLSTAGSA